MINFFIQSPTLSQVEGIASLIRRFRDSTVETQALARRRVRDAVSVFCSGSNAEIRIAMAKYINQPLESGIPTKATDVDYRIFVLYTINHYLFDIPESYKPTSWVNWARAEGNGNRNSWPWSIGQDHKLEFRPGGGALVVPPDFMPQPLKEFDFFEKHFPRRIL